ncbi:MAG TPA: DNA gyrase inhibitor YacG [Nevskia sp.]|jgi:endogenous inhibitor of DNA gyrase (YacG/DUF329 family)|nr:DNA gyrase inhibitor YacG [Nevskia sp.]
MTAPRIARCPRCGTSTRLDPQNPWRPFCSERCKLIDLGDWMSGRYALPVQEEDLSPPSRDEDQ